jgi:hypothetical protein
MKIFSENKRSIVYVNLETEHHALVMKALEVVNAPIYPDPNLQPVPEPIY